jgi:hypothetical protein
MKHVLVINYSQSGQLDAILEQFLKPFEGKAVVERVSIEVADPFVFPWSSARFFDAMPESVLEEAAPLAPYTLLRSQYDLVILGYQPWFLSPSIPTTALLQDPQFLAVLKDTPVVTVIGARNMWINSQKAVVERIKAAGGHLVANIPLIDRHQNLISALSILHWMLTGRKDRKWGLLPLPGVSSEDIAATSSFGEPVLDALQQNQYQQLQARILEQKTDGQASIDLHPTIILIESRAKQLFLMWAQLIKQKSTTPKRRAFWLGVYKYYLIIALFLISPFVIGVYTILVRPFRRKQIKAQKITHLNWGIEPLPSKQPSEMLV